MKKIALSQEGIENVYGARDANLKHIESLLNVQIRTQGGEITIEGDPKDEVRAQLIFKQLKELIDEGYPLSNGDVKTAAQLLVENADYFKTYSIDYHEGAMYPHLMRDQSKPDLLTPIFAPKVTKAPPAVTLQPSSAASAPEKSE